MMRDEKKRKERRKRKEKKKGEEKGEEERRKRKEMWMLWVSVASLSIVVAVPCLWKRAERRE